MHKNLLKIIKYKKFSHPYEHLEPIVDFLLLNGNTLARDYRWGENRTGYFCLLVNPIDFDLLLREFNFPPYVKFVISENSIECDKTWSSIKGDVPRKQ